MRLAAALVFALSVPALAGNEPATAPAPRPARTESAPKTDMDRPTTTAKPVDGKTLCTFVNPDQNAPSERGDCVAEREPVQQRPADKSPPAGPNNDATPSAR